MSRQWTNYLLDSSSAPAWCKQVIEATAPRTDEGQRDYYFDPVEAERRVKFIEQFCRYPEGAKAGQKMLLDEWQKNDIVRPVFGWKRRNSAVNEMGDMRRFRRVFIGIPRKNAKSTLIAAMALSIILQDGEQRAEVYCLASNEKQGRRVLDPIKYFIKAEPILAGMMKARKNVVSYGKYDSVLEVLASTDGRHGLNTHAVLVDELHEFLQPKQLNALEALTTSSLVRTQPLHFFMTTAGSDVNSRCFHDWEYVRKVKQGVTPDDTLLPVLYEASPEDDWHDPKVWQKANPGLGSIMSMNEFVEQAYKPAKLDPRKVSSFLRLHLNVWAKGVDGFIDDHVWMRCAGDLDMDSLKSLPMWIGLDLAAYRDTCAVAMLWVDEVHDKMYLRVQFFQNEAMMQAETGVDYLSYQREGSCIITPGDVIDHQEILRYIQGIVTEHNVQTIAYDKYMATVIIPQLVEDGIRCEMYSQSILHISEPTKQFDALVSQGKIIHDGSMMMRWQMSSVKIHTDNSENIKIVKSSKIDRVRVDGPVAAVIALGQYMHERAAGGNSDIITEVFGFDL